MRHRRVSGSVSIVTKLYPFQEHGIDLIGRAVSHGHRAVCFVMPTGTGKTKTIAELCRRHVVKVPVGRVLWLAHREELVVQAYRDLVAAGLDCGVIMASPPPGVIVNPYKPVQVASIQTLIARKIIVDGITLVVHDEAHHGPSKTWSEVVLEYKRRRAIIIGPTATPVRADGLGLGDIYDEIVCPITTKEAIAQGYLVPFEMQGPSRPLRPGTIAQRPVDAYLQHAAGRKCAVFCGNVKAAAEFCEQFVVAGVPAAVVTGDMDAAYRRGTLERYACGELRVLVSVGVLTEGWDDPPTSAVILARAIGSVSLYIQILGRALRLSPSTGKEDAVLIDLHGSSGTPGFGAPDEDREYSLEGEGIRCKGDPRIDIRFCIGCGVVLDGDALVCDLCHIAKPELVVPEVVNCQLVKFASKRREGEPKRAASLLRWMREAKDNGHKVGRAFHKYFAVYGEKPSADILKLVSELRVGMVPHTP